MSTLHRKGCRCCYCIKCDGLYRDEECGGGQHSDTCTCCKCKGDESSDWSIDKSVLNRIVSPPDVERNIEYIVKRVGSTAAENILKWININEDVLEQDLKAIGDPTAASDSSETTVSCSCSWVQLSMSSLNKYLQESTSKDVLIVPRDDETCWDKSVSEHSDDATRSMDSCNCSHGSSKSEVAKK